MRRIAAIIIAVALGLSASLADADVRRIAARYLLSTVNILAVTATTATIALSSSDGADSSELCITGGGACEAVGTTARGAKVLITGNEHASRPGEAYMEAQGLARVRAAAGPVQLRGDNTIIQSASGTTTWTANAAAGTLIGAGTGSIGWSVVAGANTACTTTCTTPCVFGVNTAATEADIVDCSDATADECLCAGAS